MRHTLRPRAAQTRPFLRFFLATAVSLCLTPATHAQSAASKRAAAHAQFERAEKQRTALQGQPKSERTTDAYLKVIAAYRRVYLISPHAADVSAAYVAVAELYQDMGRQFDPKYYQSAIDAYQFLLHEYPNSRYRDDALMTIGVIYKDDLQQLDLAEKSFQEFLKYHPRSPKAPEAQQALAEISKARQASHKPGTARKLAKEQEKERKLPQVTQIRTWNGENYTRVVIDLEDEVRYQSARIADPDRIYFDLHDAKLSSTLAGKTLEIQSGYLKTIRVAQNQAGVVRVVLEVDKVKEYTTFLLSDPYRLVVDIYGPSPLTAKAEAPAAPQFEKPAPPPYKPEKAASARDDKPSAPPGTSQPAANVPARTEAAKPQTASAAKKDRGKPGPSAREAAAALKPPTVPQPTRDGQPSLTRALGLKIGRIVIDPGHGGHDTGTIGPTGLMEKDLCLDIALRLGKIIQQRLRGAEIVYTRADDSFVPLENRTAVANQVKADLFLSIHANSSRDHKTRGVETYYLNFAASPDAMEVASRENALSQGNIHELQELVKKIARNEKIEESRELATDIQDSLTKRLQRTNRTLKNRGVRKAPFVVLIGANMPSVLSEVSFLSNPTDEQLLKKPENRQRVAEGLYHGVESYLQNINSLSLNQPRVPLGARATGVAQRGNPR
ncbi:MAG: N-acetylmuramoyl-L-alanine amidase [Acidobacteria bacterium]|nr:N-acetylmuramoyl-L-alanine amidase [Acidobacteriota bacterium]